jgi:hypothetical protein
MGEVADASAKLLVGASVYLGPKAEWPEYARLYAQVYIAEGERVLRPDGFLLVLQTDEYRAGKVMPKSLLLLNLLRGAGFDLIGEKVWKRKEADLFRIPWSHVFLFRPPHGTAGRGKIRSRAYLRGVWDFPQVSGFDAAYPASGSPELPKLRGELPKLRVLVASIRWDLIVDPFAGTARLVSWAARAGRNAVGYEINEALRPVVKQNLDLIGRHLKG